jgi:fibronectin-binding autotransporter adhesin
MSSARPIGARHSGGRPYGRWPLTKTGTGTVTLSGANTYTGGTTVSAGILQGNATSLQGNIVNNSLVIFFDQAISGSYAGVLSGTGSLTKTDTETPNQIAVASALSKIEPAVSGDMLDVMGAIYSLSTEGAIDVYSQMGGLVHTAITGATFSGINSYKVDSLPHGRPCLRQSI